MTTFVSNGLSASVGAYPIRLQVATQRRCGKKWRVTSQRALQRNVARYVVTEVKIKAMFPTTAKKVTPCNMVFVTYNSFEWFATT